MSRSDRSRVQSGHKSVRRKPDYPIVTLQGVLPKELWPEELQLHPMVRGIYVGGCYATHRKFRAAAHAHHQSGWICFWSGKHVHNPYLYKHELAHIVTREAHTRTWREYLLAIGGTLDAVPGLMGSYYEDSE